MKISELIDKLSKIQEESGDLDIVIYDSKLSKAITDVSMVHLL